MNGVEKGRESSAFGLVSDRPIIPFVEGDGTGPDIWKASRRVFDAAVSRAYGGTRAVQWREVLAGEKGFRETGSWLPDETVESFRMHRIGIKGPLTTPVGEGIRSLNVALRQTLDLYVCLRPVRYFQGIVSPVVHPERVDMVVFRENTEDVYAGMEVPAGDERTDRISAFLKSEMGWNIGPDTGIGIKPVSRGGSERLIRAAIKYALACGRKSVTLVHKGNIMKYTEGAFMRWGYELAQREFPGKVRLPEGREGTGNSGEGDLVIKDVIADAFLQQILTRPEEYDVIATLNLNGDYISDAWPLRSAESGSLGRENTTTPARDPSRPHTGPRRNTRAGHGQSLGPDPLGEDDVRIYRLDRGGQLDREGDGERLPAWKGHLRSCQTHAWNRSSFNQRFR